jgi:hypothetical protein
MSFVTNCFKFFNMRRNYLCFTESSHVLQSDHVSCRVASFPFLFLFLLLELAKQLVTSAHENISAALVVWADPEGLTSLSPHSFPLFHTVLSQFDPPTVVSAYHPNSYLNVVAFSFSIGRFRGSLPTKCSMHPACLSHSAHCSRHFVIVRTQHGVSKIGRQRSVLL